MENRDNNSAAYTPEIKDDNENYHQPQVDGKDQIVIVDRQVTAETDDLDFAFHRLDPQVDPEDQQEKDKQEDRDENFSEREDEEEDDFDLNHDADDDLSLNIDDDKLN